MTSTFHRAGLLQGSKEVIGAMALLAVMFVPTAFAVAESGDDPIGWLKVGDDPASMMTTKPRSADYRRDQTEYDHYRLTQAALIKSPDILRNALNDPAIAKLKLIQGQQDPLGWLKESITVKFPSDSEVLQISLKADDKAEAAKVINAVMDSYLKNVVDKERQQTLAYYESWEKSLHADLAAKEERPAKSSARSNVATADLAQKKICKFIDLSADVRKKLYEVELQAIASRIRAEDSEADAVERRKAKTELSIAEAQKKYLRELLEQLSAERSKLESDGVQSAAASTLKAETERKEIAKELEQKLSRLRLLMQLPPRVTLLMEAKP